MLTDLSMVLILCGKLLRKWASEFEWGMWRNIEWGIGIGVTVVGVLGIAAALYLVWKFRKNTGNSKMTAFAGSEPEKAGKTAKSSEGAAADKSETDEIEKSRQMQFEARAAAEAEKEQLFLKKSEKVPNELLVLVDDIVRKLAVGAQLEFLLEILLLALGDTLEIPVVDTGALLEEGFEGDAVALDIGADLHVGEMALTPQTGNGVSDEVARQIDRISGNQSRRRLEDLLVQILHTVDADITDVVALRGAFGLQHGSILGEELLRGGRGILLRQLLGPYIRAVQRQQGRNRHEYLTGIIHLYASNLTSFI